MKKTLRMQVVVSDGMVSIETPTLTEPGDFYYSGIFDHSGITGAGMQANNEDPEWPTLKKRLDKIGEAAISAWIVRA